jgi:hypothetical protein
MSWQREMVRILRHLINDLDDDNPTYTDDRLEEVILVSAQLFAEEIDWENTYTIEIDEHHLSPDPTNTSNKDDGFINLVCLKAAVVILRGEAKTLARQSYRIVDGPSTIDVRGTYEATKALLKDYEDTLGQAINQFKMGNSVAGQAILTPYTTTQVSNRYTIF